MKEYVIEQLRRQSFIPRREKTWVSKLSDQQLYEMFLRLKRGESCRSIARHAQKEWGINIESTTRSVSQGILKFKKRIAHLLLPPPDESYIDSNFSAEISEEGSLEALCQIANLQEERIKRMMAEEMETGIKYPHINRDIQALAGLQKVIMKLSENVMTPEEIRKKKTEEKRDRIMKQRFDKLRERVSYDQMDRVIQAGWRFLELALEDAETMYVGPDGEYHILEREADPAGGNESNKGE